MTTLRRRKSSVKAGRVLNITLTYAVLIFFAFLFIFPMLFMFVSSLKANEAIFADLRSIRAFLPVGDLSWDNFRYVFERGNFPRYLLNSVVITGSTVALSILVNSMAAYSLARLRWRGRSAVMLAIVALLVVPFDAIAIPMLLMVSRLPGVAFGAEGMTLTDSWFNTHIVQIFPFVASAFTIFLFYQFFLDLPKELDEAARVDGATPFQIYWKIVMPLAKPVIATVAILQSLAMWNQYLWPIMAVQSAEARPVMPGIQEFFTRSPEWGQIMAYSSLVTLPLLIIFILFQRFFVRSVATGGLKG
ncbi:carbohydrate ABC transporter permease [Deinococcus apachensis]|uniref:carbohydrate ABC transporter permease n=1 Tax=Deinococcus apachensis TaxID=309886 RepID=UPI00035EAD48|nr:carbohydrate ABC transporter permease [Deinococcus apachensis]